jgi:hypothetical protein
VEKAATAPLALDWREHYLEALTVAASRYFTMAEP